MDEQGCWASDARARTRTAMAVTAPWLSSSVRASSSSNVLKTLIQAFSPAVTMWLGEGREEQGK
jgi:hypothetical protein